MTIVLGIAGALLAGFLGRSLGWYANGGGPGIIASIIGAMLLLFFYRMFSRGRHVPV